jgi:hypothetical protein
MSDALPAAVQFLRRTISTLLMIALCTGAAVLGVIAYEWSLPEPQEPSETNFSLLMLHPFSGFHNIGPSASAPAAPDALKTLIGDRPHRETDNTVNILGFADTVNVLDPPTKPPNELRIIIIGGSGAQGQGVSSFLERFEVKLEKWINEKLAGSGWHVRFINMAMGGAISYQNFIQLNRWGRQLQPDAIISYSGRNDLWVPLLERSDGYFWFHQVAYLVTIQDYMVYPDEPDFIQLLARYLPRIYHYSSLRAHLKNLLFGERYKQIALNRYRAQLGYDKIQDGQAEYRNALHAIAVPQQVHALKSIKRDLLGVPIVLSWQVLADFELGTILLSEQDYDGMFEAVRGAVAGYCNDDWLFLNTHAMLRDMKDQSLGGAHLTDKGHTVLARVLLEPIHKVVMQVIERRKAGARASVTCDEPLPTPFIPPTAKSLPTQFDTWSPKGVTVQGGIRAPDGTESAATLIEHQGLSTKQVVAIGSDLRRNLVASVHGHHGAGRRLLLFTAIGDTDLLSCDVDLETGKTAVKSHTDAKSPNCTAVSLTDGWWRIDMSGSFAYPIKGHLMIGLAPTMRPFERTYEADGTGHVIVWGASIGSQ